MKQLLKNILATLSGLALAFFPQLTIAEEEVAEGTSTSGESTGGSFRERRSSW